jgi:hypothetical protein
MVLVWEANHGFTFQLRTGEGSAQNTTLQSRTPRLDPGRWYDLKVTYEATKGLIVLSVDGKLAARARARGPLVTEPPGDMAFGNPFGQKSFDGFVGAFDLRANEVAHVR